MRPPRDNLVRAMPEGLELRENGDAPAVLTGHFAVFNEWTRIDSAYEGQFMERIAPGAFDRTFKNNGASIRVLLNHGKDPQLGDKPITGPPSLHEDARGAAYEAELLDGLPPLVVSGLRQGQYGSSFRFRVMAEEVNQKPNRSAANPDGIPERTIKEAQVFEFGPVTFPAYAGATAGIRSMTDEFILDRFLEAPDRLRDIISPRLEAPAPEPEAEPHLEAAREKPDPPPSAAPSKTQDPPSGGSSDSKETTVEYTSREDKAARVAELQQALERQATAYPGVLPIDEQTRWDADKAELDTLNRDIAAWDSRQAETASFAKDPGRVVTPVLPDYSDRGQINRKPDSELHSATTRANTFEGSMAEYRDDAMRILEKTKFPTNIADQERSADRLAYLLDNADSPDKELARRVKFTGAPIYMRAFEKIMKAKGSTIGLTPEEQRGTALAVGVDATGGFAVPFAFDPTVIAIGVNNGAINPYRRQCRVVTIVGTDTWNAITATAVVATRTTEAAASVEQGPTFAQPQYIVKRVQGQITASFEMFQDRTDLASEMAALIQEAKDNEEETSWATGAGAGTASIGVGPVTGTSGAFTSVATAGASLAAADADLAEAALPVRHRFNAQWFLSRSAIRRFQTLETTGGKLFGGNVYPAVGNPMIDAAGNTGLRLLGYPVNESPSLPTSTATTITIGSLVNVNQYVIVDRVGLSVQFIPFILNSSSLATGQQALYFLYRNDARPINVDGGRILRYV